MRGRRVYESNTNNNSNNSTSYATDFLLTYILFYCLQQEMVYAAVVS